LTLRVRLLEASDLASIAEIVNHYIETSVIHFGDTPQTAADWRDQWWPVRDAYPWLVAEEVGTVVGVAYAKPWNARAAYAWTAETTIYLRHGHTGRGVGPALYARLLGLLDAQGYRSIVAGITIPNASSVRLHEALGFRPLGTLHKVGYKEGAWHDVGLWQRQTGGGGDPPGPIRPLAEIDVAARLR